MPDNTTLSQGSGGDIIRDIDKGGAKTPVVTLDLGGAGAESLIDGAMPVTGTFWQSTQPVSIASAVPVTGTFWQATQPVSAASLPLPSGAATSAKQPALGTAGTAATDVLTVQGIASMTPLKVDGSAVTQPVSIASAVTVAQATAGNLNATVVGTGTFAVQASQSGTWNARMQDGAGTGLTSLAVGSQHAITVAVVDASGNQVTSFGGGSGGGTSSNFAAAFPAAGTAIGAKDSTGTNMVPLNLDASGNLKVLAAPSGTYTVSGTVGVSGSVAVTGTFWQATQPVSGTVTANVGTTNGLALDATLTGGTQKTKLVDSGGTNVASVSAGGALKVDGSAATQPVSGTVTVTQATASNLKVDLSGTAANATAIKVDGSAVTQPVSGTFWQATQPVSGTVAANPAAATSGGATPYHLISAASTNATSVKASAGTIYAISAFNTNAAARFLKLYDSASSPTVGTTSVVQTFMIPPSGGFTLPLPVGMAFSSGIALSITGAITDADTTAVGASDVAVSLTYK